MTNQKKERQIPVRAAFIVIALLCSLHLMAQEADSTSLRPSFGVDYTGDVLTDFKLVRFANILELHADVPLSRKLSVQVGSLSAASTDNDLSVNDIQGFSSIDTYGLDIPFALTVAGVNWQINDRNTLFAGIRRIDEDYFCSDGLALYTNSSPGIFPTVSWNVDSPTFPMAAMGIHYAYDHKNLRLQASVYNGKGHYRFAGRKNVFRICPNSDNVFVIGQAEYRHRGSHYYLGGTLHTDSDINPSAWIYAEQALVPNLTLIAIYGHAFGSGNLCDNFYGLGGKYALKRAEFGVFTDYVYVVDVEEWATEFIFSYHLTDFLTVKPALHVIDTDGRTTLAGLLRVDISF